MPDDINKDEPKTERFNMFMSPSEMDAIDTWAWNHRIRSKSEAVRRLCKIAIALTDLAERYGERAGRSFTEMNLRRKSGDAVTKVELEEALKVLAALATLSARARPYLNNEDFDHLVKEDAEIHAMFKLSDRSERDE